MINLVIDIGNTLTKVAVFNDRVISDLQVLEQFDTDSLKRYLDREKIDNAIISSVDKEISDMEYIIEGYCNYVRFSAGTPTRIINQYRTPQTLGVDRLAAVIGAEAMLPSTNCLVIDAGSCITYDFIDSKKNYYGGSISPGINMRFKSMNAFTDRLPLVIPDIEFTDKYGSDTRSSMLAGVQFGVWSEALGFIEAYATQHSDMKIILCGGDVKFFETRLKSSIFAHAVKTEPNLVLIGLNEVIYQQND
jgi:type III pantothenate kinase